jgi:hypothetical protein
VLPPGADVEKNQAVREFLNRNLPSMTDALDNIDRNYADLSLIDKIAVSITIRRAYQYAQVMEKRVMNQNQKEILDMDLVIRSLTQL